MLGSALDADQSVKLRALLRALRTNPFYTSKLQEAGVDPDLCGLADLPFTWKRELVEDQRANPPFGSNLTYPLARYTRLSRTSATTDKPLNWLDTPESWDWMLDNWMRVFSAAGVTSEDRIFFAFSFGMFLGFWTAFDSAARLGCLRIPGGGMSSAARLDAMLDAGVTVLCCTPTYALRLAEVAAQEGIDLARGKVRRIVVAGEPGGSVSAVRTRIEGLWPGARVVDHHGMTETGPVSYGCPLLPDVLHVIESAYIAEVIDPDSGKPVSRGELALTTLGRLGSPLLRYRTGDLVERASEGQCECGSDELALRGGILGRTDDMVVVRGVNVYPSAVEDVLRAAGGVAEYRVEIHNSRSLAELRIQVEPSPDCGDETRLAEKLQASLYNLLSLRIPVSCVPRGKLPRFEMKAKRWVTVA